MKEDFSALCLLFRYIYIYIHMNVFQFYVNARHFLKGIQSQYIYIYIYTAYILYNTYSILQTIYVMYIYIMYVYIYIYMFIYYIYHVYKSHNLHSIASFLFTANDFRSSTELLMRRILNKKTNQENLRKLFVIVFHIF